MDTYRDLSESYIKENPDLVKVERPIPYNEFLYHSKRRNKSLEYMILKKITETKKHSEYLVDDQINFGLNRYKDILPYRDTIVEISSGQYINASYILAQPSNTKSIIATQGPLPCTTSVFWKMIWEQQVSLILMCCGFSENDIPKCHEYIPICGSSLYEDFEVTFLKETYKFESIIKKSFVLTNTVSGEHKKITHIQILNWEDNTVPNIKENFSGFNYIVYMIRHKQERHAGKVVIHCSAGIGRTGVLIGIYEMVNSLEEQFKLDDNAYISVFKTVRKMREQRWGMVNTEEQYEFLYSFMEYWIATYIYSKEN